jgi:hypothetical protein
MMTSLVTSLTDGKVVRTFSDALSLEQVAQEISQAEVDFLYDFD